MICGVGSMSIERILYKHIFYASILSSLPLVLLLCCAVGDGLALVAGLLISQPPSRADTAFRASITVAVACCCGCAWLPSGDAVACESTPTVGEVREWREPGEGHEDPADDLCLRTLVFVRPPSSAAFFASERGAGSSHTLPCSRM